MLGTKIKFEGVKGVGTVELDLQEGQRVYTLIGTNGVGKTKTLEALFQVLFFTNENLFDKTLIRSAWAFKSAESKYKYILSPSRVDPNSIHKFSIKAAGVDVSVNAVTLNALDINGLGKRNYQHNLPIIFLASQNRGFIEHGGGNTIASFGSFNKRKSDYLKSTVDGMASGFASLNMDNDIEQWFVTLAQSSNKFQKKSDNREVEINTVLNLLNKLDNRIGLNDPEIDGDGRVSLTIDGQARELSHLSTGFASILKIIQAIVSGYGYFTNENNLEHVKGIVLIDEIESHLHLTWQAKIIPVLKKLFPNTAFYITTHSSIVLSQLEEGEAYRLERDDDGAVRTKLLKRPNKASIIDVLKDAFNIDVNKLKRDNMSPDDQKMAKQQLLDLLNEEDSIQ